MPTVMQNAPAGLRSDTNGVYNSHNQGLRCRSTPGYILEAHTRFSSLAIAYLNRIARAVRPYNVIR